MFTHFNNLTPSDDKEITSPDSVPSDSLLLFQQVIAQCVLQLLLIHVINDIMVVVDTDTMGLNNIILLCDCLEESWEFAHQFNENEELRYNLWKAGFMKQRPNLHKQETTSIMSLINILLKIVGNAEVEERFTKVIEKLILTYLKMNKQESRNNSKNQLKPAIELVLDYFVGAGEDIFDRIGKNLYKSFVMIMRTEQDENTRYKACDVLVRFIIYF